MKTLTYTTAIFMAMVATSVFAHHPSLDTNPNYDIVDAQLEAVESPHLDMDVSDMGATTDAGDSDMATSTQGQAGFTSGDEDSQAGTMTLDQPQEGPGPDAAAAAAAADTMDLLE